MKRVIMTVFIAASIIALGVPAAAVAIDSNARYEAQISFFKDSLDEFSASAPDQTIRLWVKGDEMRNGVYKYAVGSQSVKRWLTDRWGKPDKNFWIIGGSSPQLGSYEVISRTTISPREIRYVVKYNWTSSTPPDEPSVEHLTVSKENDAWYIAQVDHISGPQYY